MMLGIAVVGAGHWGPHLVRNFNDHLASQVLWVIEKSEGRRKAIGERFPSVNLGEELDQALEDTRVDAVVVATPTSTHYPIVASALAAGKHVLVEKPIADSLEQARDLCRSADARGLVLMVGHVFLFNPAIEAGKRLINSGDLGGVQYLSMVRTNLGPVRVDVSASWDLASHDVSVANYWLDGAPIAVSAVGGSWLNPGIQDVVFATLRYPGDVLVHIEASWLHPRKRRLISVVGDQRMLTVDDMDLTEPLRLYDKGVLDVRDEVTDTFAGFRSQIREGEVRIPHVTVGEPLRAECDAFVKRVEGERSILSDGWAGAEVVAAIEAIDRSIGARGAEVEVEASR